MSGRGSVYDWECRCGVRNRIYVKVCGGCGFSDTGEAVAHANGAYSCIAHTLGGGEDAEDFWYAQARDVLEALKRKGFVVVKAEGKL